MQRRGCCPLRRGYSLAGVIKNIKSAYGGCGAELLVVFTNGRCAKNKQPCMTDGGREYQVGGIGLPLKHF